MLRLLHDRNELPNNWQPFHPQLGWNFVNDSADGAFPIPVGEGRADDGLNLRFSLPAVMEKDFHVSILGNRLTIRGERREPDQFGDVAYFGLTYGRFEKSVLLPAGLHLETMKARFHHGVLDVHIPYLKQAKAREVPVIIGEEAVPAMAAAG